MSSRKDCRSVPKRVSDIGDIIMNEFIPLMKVIKDTEPNPDSYAVIAVKGNDAVFMFGGDNRLLIKLIPLLKQRLEESLEAETVQ